MQISIRQQMYCTVYYTEMSVLASFRKLVFRLQVGVGSKMHWLKSPVAGCTLLHISWWFPIYRLVDGKPPPLRGQRVLWFRKENSCQNQPKSVHSWTIYKRSMIHRYLNGYNRDLRLGRNLNLHNGPNLLYSADIIPFLLKLNISGILIVLCLIFL